jgi:uncharacterized protein
MTEGSRTDRDDSRGAAPTKNDPRYPQARECRGKKSSQNPSMLSGLIAWLNKERFGFSSDGARTDVVDHVGWSDSLESDRIGNYDYSKPLREGDSSPESDLILRLSHTKAFKRLEDVRFLGALDYFLVARPNGSERNRRFTRFQHSLGVAALAKAYLSLTSHSPKEKLLCVASAMLHDIGHPPFSHTLEPIFVEKFGLDHHSATEQIILGESLFGPEVRSILGDFGLHAEDVIGVLNGDDSRFDRFFSGPINLDTIEGILRSRAYLKMDRLGLTPLRVVKAATVRGDEANRQIVDSFWQSKHEMYSLVIRSRLGVFYDTLFQAIARSNAHLITEADGLGSEAQIFKKIPELKDSLRREKAPEIALRHMSEEVSFQVRRFFVDQSIDFTSGDDRLRYRQEKIGRSLTLQDIMPA